jgi:hypothetical protein
MSTLKTTNIAHPSSASNNIVLDSSGNVVLQAGTASAPALQPTSDPNTGIFFPAADTIAFAEGGSEAMRIDSSSRLLVGTTTATANGGVLELSGGITFPATAVAASNANTLDDYEEGTWTPAYSFSSGSVTQTLTVGRYTKVGNNVTVYARIGTSAISSPSGAAKITGLPFATSTVQVGITPGTVASFATDMPLRLQIEPGFSVINLHKNASTGNTAFVQGSDFASGGTSNFLDFSLSYMTT